MQTILAVASLLWICWIAALPGALATQAYELKPIMEGDTLGLYAERFEDPSRSLDFEQIQILDQQGAFEASNEAIPNFGLNPSAQWMRFQIINPSDKTQEVYFENAFTFTDEFQLYYQDQSGRWQMKVGGDQYPFSAREINSRQVVFRQLIHPGQHTYYVKAQTVGTLQLPIQIWSPEEFANANALEYHFIGLLIGIHLVICLYNLFLFISLKDVTYLSYVGYVLSNLLYQTTGLGLWQQFGGTMGWFQTVHNALMISAVDIVAITALTFSRQFLALSERVPWLDWIFKIAIGLSALNLLTTNVLSLEIGTNLCFVTASIATSLLLLGGYLVSRQGYSPARYYLFAWACYLLGVTGTLSNLLGLVPTNLFTKWGQFSGGAIEIAILSLALGARINEKRRQQVEKINELNRTLEGKVQERTEKIRNLLKHIPQGILSIVGNGEIAPSYSEQLSKILGHSEIANRSFTEAILKHSDLSEDEINQIEQCLFASINEDVLNFDSNQDKLPKQLRYQYNDQAKVLRLTWNVELDQFDQVRQVLVTLLDISDEFNAQQQLQEKNRQFQIIKQLVDIPARKSIQFFKSANQLLLENQTLINGASLGVEDIKILFVNSHTIKGAARTLALRELANALHHLESMFCQILREHHPIDTNQIQSEFEIVMEIYRSYQMANREMLDRRDDESLVPIDREFLHENVHVLDRLVELDTLPSNLQSIIHKNLHELTSKIFSSLNHIVEDCTAGAAKTATDLGKEPPEFVFELDDVLLSHKQEEAVRNCFVHLIRNALDHGIEAPDERRSLDKKTHGTLFVKGYEHQGIIDIFFSDDGSGLDLNKIRNRCQELGIEAPLAAQDTANMIFETGFSTAQKISLFSGRGVGMGAIRQYMNQVEGNACIELLERIDSVEERFRFRIHLSFPSQESLSRRAI